MYHATPGIAQPTKVEDGTDQTQPVTCRVVEVFLEQRHSLQPVKKGSIVAQTPDLEKVRRYV